MTTVGFWNTGNEDRRDLVATFAQEESLDILVLAEFKGNLADQIALMNVGSSQTYYLCEGPVGRTPIISRLPPEWISQVSDGGGLAARHFADPTAKSLLLVAVHLRSKRNLSDVDQGSIAQEIIRDLLSAEATVGHRRTLVIGDFNMSPFEQGMVSGLSFHAVSSRRVASRKPRTLLEDDRHFFYNPTWRLLVDDQDGVAGTYYYNDSAPTTYFWNAFDQALLRPALIPAFRPESLRVITSLAGTNLLTESGLPDRQVGSDHLPIVLDLNLSAAEG